MINVFIIGGERATELGAYTINSDYGLTRRLMKSK